MLKKLSVGLALVLVFTACAQKPTLSDESKYKKEMFVGTWKTIRGPAFTMTTFSSNGTFRGEMIFQFGVSKTITGKWILHQDDMIWTYDEDVGLFKKGMEDRNRIVSYTPSQFILEEIDGSKTSFEKIE